MESPDNRPIFWGESSDSAPGFVRKTPTFFRHKDRGIYAVGEGWLEVCINFYALEGIKLRYTAKGISGGV
jgi:hypothetical protein